jgi:DNA-binding CsgD family transcriptional regulator
MHRLEDHLSSGDLAALLTLCHRSLACRDEESLKKLVMALKALIGFEYAVCARARVPDLFTDPAPQVDFLNISYPLGYLEVYLQERLYLSDASICACVSNLEPVHWRRLETGFDPLFPAAALAHDFGMNDGWTHGVMDLGSMETIQFFLGWSKANGDPRTRMVVEYAVPFLAEAYRRILDGRKNQAAHLTPREIEVLHWLKEGKSSWEISLILHCSRRVVDFHVENIKKKLHSASRAQAIAAAMHQGLIDF